MGSESMPTKTPRAKTNPRKRKAHTKSRSGCRNCKIRRVKCDEAKPRCNQCTSFGVSCNYGPAASSSTGELVLSFDGASCLELLPKSPISMRQTILDLINHSLRNSPTGIALGDQVYQLKKQDLEVLDRFSNRTVLTFGSETSKWTLQAETPRLACLHPFLMHTVLALTSAHDRLLSFSNDKPTATELFHNYNATALFNCKLRSEEITSSERDALWITSTFIGAMQVCNIRAKTPEVAWPIRDFDPGEPDWLALTLGKHDIWEFCDPSRPDSCFQSVWIKCIIHGSDPEFTPYDVKDGGFHNLPSEMVEYLNLDDASTWASNPYFRAANILSQLMPMVYDQTNIMDFISFIHLMQPEFRELWAKKDPGVLLLLSYWYAKTIPFQQWWSWKRAVLECQAICIFLERHYNDFPHMERLLKFPKQYCGIVLAR